MYGIELELCDIDTRKGLPEGFDKFSDQEYDLHASVKSPYHGLPNDPTGKYVYISGELNSTPTVGYEDQLKAVSNALDMYPEAALNPRIDSHLHISLPEFKTDLDMCKKVLTYVYNNSKIWMDNIYKEYSQPDMLSADKQFINVNRKCMYDWKYANIMKANNMEDFIRFHSTDISGKYNPRMGTRFIINMISIKDHGSLEFRGLFPTLDVNMLRNHYKLMTAFVEESLSDNPRSFDIVLKELVEEGVTWVETPPKYYPEGQACWRYCSYPNVGAKYIIPRYIEFKKLWNEDSSRFNEKGWWDKDWAKFHKENYTPMTFDQAKELGLL
jgi:hypothetical protein